MFHRRLAVGRNSSHAIACATGMASCRLSLGFVGLSHLGMTFPPENRHTIRWLLKSSNVCGTVKHEING